RPPTPMIPISILEFDSAARNCDELTMVKAVAAAPAKNSRRAFAVIVAPLPQKVQRALQSCQLIRARCHGEWNQSTERTNQSNRPEPRSFWLCLSPRLPR